MHHTASSDQDQPFPYILHGAYYLKDWDSRYGTVPADMEVMVVVAVVVVVVAAEVAEVVGGGGCRARGCVSSRYGSG